MSDRRYVFVQAHRGYSSVYPEQTMLALMRAVEVGADRLEMDLALTADNEVVLMHDDTVDRTTGGHGRISDHTLASLLELDAGSWKNPRFHNERVPTLAEVIDTVPESVDLNLEIKVWEVDHAAIRRTIDATIGVVRDQKAADRVVFSSFAIEALLAVRDRVPDARLLLLDWLDPAQRDGLEIAIAHDLYAWSTRPVYAFRDRLERAVAAGLSTHIGGVSLDRSALDFVEWGVSGLSADDPESLVRFLERNGFR